MFRAGHLALLLCCSVSCFGQSSFFLSYSAPAVAISQRPVWVLNADQQPVVAAAIFRAGKANPYELALICLDRLGRIRWQTAYQSENRDLVVSDIKTGPDGGLYVAGMWGAQMSSSPKPFLAAFDAQGRFRWSKTIPLDLVDSRVKITCRANEIGLGFTTIQRLYDFVLFRFDYAGNQRGALRVDGNNSEDVLADLQLLPNGNFVALLETNANTPGQRAAGILVFNAMNGISGAFILSGTTDITPWQLSPLNNGDLGLGVRDAQGYQWLACTSTGQNARVLQTIDSLSDFQNYQTTFVQDVFIAQGPIGNGQGRLDLITRGQNANSWSLSNTLQLHSSLSPPVYDVNGNVYVLATASTGGPAFNEELIYIKSNTLLDLCYEQKLSIAKAGQARSFSRVNFPIQAGNIVLQSINLPWTPQKIQFSAKSPNCNTIQNTPLLPTAFSPNGDGLNETFGPLFAEFPHYSLRIYNRMGQLLFEGENRHWDGTIAAKAVPSGSYPYVFDYTDTRGRISRVNGQLVLLR